MILGIVFIGLIAGIASMAAAILASAPWWVAGLAYVGGGMAGTLCAAFIALARRRPPLREALHRRQGAARGQDRLSQKA